VPKAVRRKHPRLHFELRLQLKATAEETVQKFCRIGYCGEQQHTPRRGVDAIVRS
jgi:hypothetical protein